MSIFLGRWAKLYSDPTPAERALEPAVASLGVPYRFQHPLWALHVFPDFVLLNERVVIEVDDPGHETKKGRAKDAERTLKLERAGWRVVRTRNAEALADPGAALDAMMIQLGLPYRAFALRMATTVPSAAPAIDAGINQRSADQASTSKADAKLMAAAKPAARKVSRAATAAMYPAHKKSPTPATASTKATRANQLTKESK